MVNGLIDTVVAVDIIRGFAPALAWIPQQGELGAPRIIWIEVLEGARDKQAKYLALKVLTQFTIIPMTATDMDQATELMSNFRLSHGMSGYDCMIAAVAIRLNLPLYTHNLKHFTPMIGSLAIKPY